ncbi:MAG: radical SAM protein [Candidatus Lokiarchaeota archaeon]|nr:radical SAM protein [Candidatus Lokiarchaeota archaeon]
MRAHRHGWGKMEEIHVIHGEKINKVVSKKYNFIFDKETGFSMRWGETRDQDPFWGPLPELADISISNRCNNNCPFCYRNSTPDGPLISIEEYEMILEQLPTTFQVALGGGEPTLHPDFIDILELTREYDIVPNYTTNGNNLTPEILEASKKHCGAVAVSWYPGALTALRKMVEYGIKTNIHFIVTPDSISEAIGFIQNPDFFRDEGINAIIFLLHKAVGRGKPEDTPSYEDVKPMIEAVFETTTPVGFDACFMKHVATADSEGTIEASWTFLDFCDASRFSIYIDENLIVQPCSFCLGEVYGESLEDKTVKEIWTGNKFQRFRKLLREDPNVCPAIKLNSDLR